MRWLLSVILLCASQAWADCSGSSPTWTSTPDEASVETCIANATAGDTINLSAGTGTWSGGTIAKALTINGAGTGAGNKITITGNHTVTKQAGGKIIFQNLNLEKLSGGNESKGFTIGGSLTAQPVIFSDNVITIGDSGTSTTGQQSQSGFIAIDGGGLIFAGNTVTACWDCSIIHPKDAQDDLGSWTSDHTLGTADTDGVRNIYVEDNTFTGGTNQGVDCDDSCRIVWRFNTHHNSSFNSHGCSSSAFGARHFEIYENAFNYTYAGESGDSSSWYSNQNWQIWIRGGTGYILNNSIADINSEWWGDKGEIQLSCRAACDGYENCNGQSGCCETYPCVRQVGRNWVTGTGEFTERMQILGNTGTLNTSVSCATWAGCSQLEDAVQLDRDYGLQGSGITSGTGSGTRASRPATCTTGRGYWSTDGGTNWNTINGAGVDGAFDRCTSTNTWTDDYYVPYEYPHPLRSAEEEGPDPPTNFRIIGMLAALGLLGLLGGLYGSKTFRSSRQYWSARHARGLRQG